MRSMITVLVVASLLGVGCSAGGGADAPEIDAATAAQLQARAFQRACMDVICPGAPIYAPESTSEAIRQAIVTQFTDEVQYLSDAELEPRTGRDGRFSDGATMITVERARSTGRDDVAGVDVAISKGFRDFTARTYLFLWKNNQWVDTSPDAVDVTVTSSVS
jgi:hypothetical protein